IVHGCHGTSRCAGVSGFDTGGHRVDGRGANVAGRLWSTAGPEDRRCASPPSFIGCPTNTPKHEVSVGRLRIEAGKDAPPLPGPHPLIVFSHSSPRLSIPHL